MTPWRWWWLADGDDEDGGWEGDHATREAAIADARRSLPAGTGYAVIEARSSAAMKYEGADCVPFLRSRQKELHLVPQATDSGVDLDPPMKRI